MSLHATRLPTWSLTLPAMVDCDPPTTDVNASTLPAMVDDFDSPTTAVASGCYYCCLPFSATFKTGFYANRDPTGPPFLDG
jgi:hypothetical protein